MFSLMIFKFLEVHVFITFPLRYPFHKGEGIRRPKAAMLLRLQPGGNSLNVGITTMANPKHESHRRREIREL